MKHIIFTLVAVAVGFATGWYIGHTRPVAQNQRRILKEYEVVRDMMGYTDAEVVHAAKTFPKVPEVLASLARQDELTAALAVATVKQLERGDSEAAKKRLLSMLGGYYRAHRSNELYTNMMAHIEKAALQSPSIAAEIAKKSE